MIRRLPVISTIIVAAAVALMICLGVWQLHRAKWKDALIARYAAAENLPAISWPTTAIASDQLPLFRHATGMCLRPLSSRAVVGENKAGEPGYAQVVSCRTGAEGPGMNVELGWSKNPAPKFKFSGGQVTGVIAPDQQAGMRLVSANPPPGLEQSAPPSLASIRNNHRSYAVQWFAFAAIALVIYLLAVRKRLVAESGR